MDTTTTKPQHIVAWEKAQRIRIARAQLKRQIRDREVSAAETIMNVPEVMETMKLGAFLKCQKGWGDTKVHSACKALGVPATVELAYMTDRQRAIVYGYLAANEARRQFRPGRPTYGPLILS